MKIPTYEQIIGRFCLPLVENYSLQAIVVGEGLDPPLTHRCRKRYCMAITQQILEHNSYVQHITLREGQDPPLQWKLRQTTISQLTYSIHFRAQVPA